MKNNVIWVDFTAKVKSKNKPKGFFSKITDGIKNIFKPSGSYSQRSKLVDNYHKSIL